MSDSSGEEAFEDAIAAEDDFTVLSDLSSIVEHTGVTLHLFLNNHFSEARNRLKPFADRSFYHAHAYSTILSLEAILTFQPVVIEKAADSLRNTVEICHQHRKKVGMFESLSNMVRGVDYNAYSETEVHAELCYAESLLLQALLTIVQDENMMSLVRSGLKVRSAFYSYRSCYQMIKQRNWSGLVEDRHFLSGVYFGVGTFHLMMSLLPPKILKLLQFIGFTGRRRTGLAQLEKGHALQNTLRGPLCSLVLLGYYLVIIHLIDDTDLDMAYIEDSLLKPFLEKYPKGCITLMFKARYHVLKGDFEQAIEIYKSAATCQKEWKHFNHISFWDVTLCHGFLCQWGQARDTINILLQENRWSKATYAYFKSSLMLMDEDLSAVDQAEVDDLMTKIPQWKQRIAGKSIPPEKFALLKSEQYFEEGKTLTIPALEFMYFWNTFQLVKHNMEALLKLKELCEKALAKVNTTMLECEYYWDERLLVQLLEAVCLRLMDRAAEAELYLLDIVQEEGRIKKAVHIIPYAHYELGLIYIQTNRSDKATETLENALAKAKGSLENRLYMRCHAALRRLRTGTYNGKVTSVLANSDSDVFDKEPEGFEGTETLDQAVEAAEEVDITRL